MLYYSTIVINNKHNLFQRTKHCTDLLIEKCGVRINIEIDDLWFIFIRIQVFHNLPTVGYFKQFVNNGKPKARFNRKTSAMKDNKTR
jgi:hypothetical protein